MTAILRLLAMGVPAAKIIAKYGKKAYTTTKKQWSTYKGSDKAAWDILLGGSLGLGVVAAGLGKLSKKSRENKEKKIKPRTKKKYGGKIKTYAKGSIVRKTQVLDDS